MTPWKVRVFWGHVQQGEPDACWPWMGSLEDHGYGRTRMSGINGAHRVAWFLANGPIPPGAVIRHSCDNKPCCNPRHLLAGTHADNMADRIARPVPRPLRLKAEHVAQIRKRAAEGWDLHQLAAKHGVSVGVIGTILRRHRWW